MLGGLYRLQQCSHVYTGLHRVTGVAAWAVVGDYPLECPAQFTPVCRLAALKEYAFMKALGDHGFPVPQAVDNNRHAVLMTMLDAHPLVQVKKLQHPAQVCL